MQPGETNEVHVTATREYRPMGLLWHAAGCLRDIAENGTQGSAWAGVGGIVLLAFSVEAFCQQFGPEVFPDTWEGRKGVERFPVLDKLKAIGRKAGVQVDYGLHPWADIKALIEVRDSLAHPKPTDQSAALKLVLTAEEEAQLHTRSFIKMPWEIMAEPATAARVAEEVEQALATLLEALGHHRYELELLGTGSYSFSTIPRG